MTERQAIKAFENYVNSFPSYSAAARSMGVAVSMISMVMSGTKLPSRDLLKQIGIEVVTVRKYRQL